jgi:two-component system CheB/CheR fusion protein
VLDFFQNLFNPYGFPPRWHCGLWSSELGWLTILSDIGIWSAYYAIPFVLVYVAYRRRDVPFRPLFWLFGAFILSCGTVHLTDAVIFWWPIYRFMGLIKFITAVVSWATVIALVPAIPLALRLRTPKQLEEEVRRRTEELIQANEALRRGEERLRLALEAGRMGTWEWDIQSNRVMWSSGLEALHGIPPGSFPGTFEAFEGYICDEDRECVLRVLREAIEEGKEHRVEYRLRWPDGSLHWVESRGQLIRDPSGQPMRMIGVRMDISERKRTEQSLREAHRRKDEFLAMLAHELRNPLAPIRSGLDLLAMGGVEQETVGVMQEQLDHVVRLVDDLLDMARIMQGKIPLHKETIPLHLVVQRSLDSVTPLVEAQNHELTVSLPTTPLWLEADPVRMAQVITNLLNNSIKYTPRGGHIWFTVGQEEEQAVISVRDDGIGMDAELLPHVFDLFTQADRSLDRSQGGLGVGLTLVKNLVEMHGGTVEAHSEGPGKGSEFVVRLPISTRPHQLPEQPSKSESITPRRILIVEDHPVAAKMLALVLKKTGAHEVQVAHDGEAGLAAAKTFQPEIVLLDIGLPRMNGYEVAERLRAESGGDKMLIVALTGYGQEEDRRRSSEAGFDEHLLKPPPLEVLQALFRHPKLQHFNSISSQ